MGFLNAVSQPIEIKSASPQIIEQNILTAINWNDNRQQTQGMFKAVIPQYLYTPPFGFPRNINVPFLRSISKNGYIGAVIKLLQDQVAGMDWVIRPKAKGVQLSDKDELERQKIVEFLNNPNDDDESLAQILRKVVLDFAVLDSPCIVKVFNPLGELIQFRAVDGGTIVKNPDVFGRIGGRDDYIFQDTAFNFGTVNLNPDDHSYNAKKIFSSTDDAKIDPKTAYMLSIKQFNSLYGNRAAYFQFSNSVQYFIPIPFGKKEIIYMMQNPSTDGVYSYSSPVINTVDIVLNLIYGAKYNTDFYLNSNTPEGIIQLAGASNEQIVAIQERIKNAMYSTDEQTGLSRRTGYRMPVTNSVDTKFIPLTFNSKDMEIIEQQKWFTRVLWSSFGVTADELGFTEYSSKNVSGEQMKASSRKAIKPFLKTIEYYFNTQLLPDIPGGNKYNFVFDDYDIDDTIKRRTLQRLEMNMGIRTWQGIAAEEGLDLEALRRDKEEDLKFMELENETKNVEKMNANQDNNPYNVKKDKGSYSVKESQSRNDIESKSVEVKSQLFLNDDGTKVVVLDDDGKFVGTYVKEVVKVSPPLTNNDIINDTPAQQSNGVDTTEMAETAVESEPVGVFESYDKCVLSMIGKGHDKESAERICKKLQEEN